MIFLRVCFEAVSFVLSISTVHELRIVARMPVAKRWLYKQRPSLCNALNIYECTAHVSGQRLGKHVPAATVTNATIEEQCFLCGPFRDVISKEKISW
jgi:hypothetical protein